VPSQAHLILWRAKYDAWAARKGRKRDVAMRGYINLVEHLQPLA